MQYPTYALAAYHLGIIDTFEKLQSLVAQHVKYAYAIKSLTVDQILAVAEDVVGPRDARAPMYTFDLDAMRQEAIRDEALAKLPPDLQLDPTQAHAVHALTNANTVGFQLVRGGPGCGKSLVARAIAAANATNVGVLFMASTNRAGRVLSEFAETVHTTCNIPVDGAVLPPFSCQHPFAHALTT